MGGCRGRSEPELPGLVHLPGDGFPCVPNFLLCRLAGRIPCCLRPLSKLLPGVQFLSHPVLFSRPLTPTAKLSSKRRQPLLTHPVPIQVRSTLPSPMTWSIHTAPSVPSLGFDIHMFCCLTSSVCSLLPCPL